MLNEELLKSQKCTEVQIEEIYELHSQLEVLIDQSRDKTLSDEQYKQIGLSVEQIEFALQVAWNFKEDANFHRHYMKLDQCSCPILDNLDDIGHRRWVSGDCKYHKINKEIE